MLYSIFSTLESCFASGALQYCNAQLLFHSPVCIRPLDEKRGYVGGGLESVSASSERYTVISSVCLACFAKAGNRGLIVGFVHSGDCAAPRHFRLCSRAGI